MQINFQVEVYYNEIFFYYNESIMFVSADEEFNNNKELFDQCYEKFYNIASFEKCNKCHMNNQKNTL